MRNAQPPRHAGASLANAPENAGEPVENRSGFLGHPRASESSKLDRREPPRFAGTPTEAEHLAHAIARIGELDCTRTLPGRLVWYTPYQITEPMTLASVAAIAASYAERFGYQATRQGGLESWPNSVPAAPRPDPEPLDISTALANGDSR